VPRFAIQCTIGQVADPVDVLTTQILKGRWPFLSALLKQAPEWILAEDGAVLPLIWMFAPPDFLKAIRQAVPQDTSLGHRDQEGNTLLHYALARILSANPCYLSLPRGAEERRLYDDLLDFGLDPDTPNAGGFSCNQIIGIIQARLAKSRPPVEDCENLI
jgi:hypothetical protein